MHVGYVVKRYPRFSETFIVNEILAHEAAGTTVTIFALGAGLDERFQEAIARVRGSVCYLVDSTVRSSDLLHALSSVRTAFPESAIDPWLHEQPKYARAAARLALEVRNRGVHHLHAHFATSATTTARPSCAKADGSPVDGRTWRVATCSANAPARICANSSWLSGDGATSNSAASRRFIGQLSQSLT